VLSEGAKEHDFGLVCVQQKSIYSEPLFGGSSASIGRRDVELDRFDTNFDEQVRVISKVVIFDVAAGYDIIDRCDI